jgi:hypothetical protein
VVALKRQRPLAKEDHMTPNIPDRQSLGVWLVVVVLGMLLGVVAWFRYLT